MQPVHSQPLLSRAEAAAWLGVSVATVARMIARGQLQTKQIGSRTRILRESVDALLSKENGGAK